MLRIPLLLATALLLGCGAAADETTTTVFEPATGTSEANDDADDDDESSEVSTSASSDDDDDATSVATDGTTTGGETVPATGSGGTETGTETGDEACVPAPAPDPDWLLDYQDTIVTGLALTIGERASPSGRSEGATFIADAFTGLELAPQLHDYGTGTNVYAELPATDGSSSVLVVGAHYDSVPNSPGANDNATGVAIVLALARYLATIECRTHNVLFVLFDEEEIGLVGSDAFAQFLAGQDIDVQAVHTVDQMGWDADRDRTIELERADPGLFEFYERATTLLPMAPPLQPTQTGFTDHVSFREWGFAAVGLTEEYVSGDTTPHYHLPTDTYATVSLPYLASTTTLVNLAFALELDGAQ